LSVLESLAQGARASIEVVPPERGGDIEEIIAAVELIMPHRPAFVSVTDHPRGRAWADTPDGAERVALRTKPGTLGTAFALRDALKVETVPHLVARGSDRLAMEDLLIDLHYAGFRDVFVVRGDERFSPAGSASPASLPSAETYLHASDLVSHIAALNRGEYSPPSKGKPTAFTVGVAGYPEKHIEAPNFEADLERLVAKVEAGAGFIVTQMVFDAAVYALFVARLRDRGVTVPVLPGIKPLLRLSSLRNVPKTFFVNVPPALAEALEDAKSPAEERAAGLAYAVKLCRELLDSGAPTLHFFTMGSGLGTKAVLDALYGSGGAR
jgi:methylenetetrahydrofolate reductase (NADPH)